ncbi:MAG: thiol reductant ABC exporter subunit CydC [Bacteroidetes bacterium]|jgi:ATP-binding cassette subfamily C protein CydC|nr:thiol reductant ABC exporter subunit CydC [Bacteroidota bacterium]
MIRKLLFYIKGHKLHFAGSLALAIATIATGIGLMSASGYLISRAAQRPMLVDLFMVTAAVRFFGISRAVVRYTERLVSHDLTFRILSVMRSQLYRKLDSLSLAWMMGRKSGDLLSRLVGNIDTLQNAFLRILTPALTAFVISLFTITGLWFFEPSLAMATLVSLSFSGIIIPLIAIRIAKGSGSKDVTLTSDVKAFFADRLAGLQDVIWLGQKQNTKDELAGIQQQIDNIHHKNAGISGMLEGLHILGAHLGMFAVLVMAIPLVLQGTIPGVMLAMLTLGVLSSFEAVQNLGNAFLYLENYQESAARISAITDTADEKDDMSTTTEIPKKYDIAFENIFFSYKTEHITLQDISFTIKEQSTIAIVGPTGCGKSTLVNLMLRFWDPQTGIIRLDQSDIRHLDVEYLRSLFSVVSQDAYIFNRSLRENLLLAAPSATDQQLEGVLERVGLGAFTDDLDLSPGNFGKRLSGGEQRLLSLAMALRADAPIWILDEPTSNLDVGTERKVLDTIREAAKGRTVIMITHRLLDMEKMDQVLVMHRGQLIGMGTHLQLLKENSFYASMLNYQRDFR